MKTQDRVELRYAADKSSLSPEHKLGTVSRVAPNGDFSVSYDTYVLDDGKRTIRVRGGRYTYRAHQATSFTVLA